MTHLYIELNTGLTENVSSSVIKKLYELAVGGTLDATSDIKGTLHTTVASAREKAYLEGEFSDLHITADEYSLTFNDPEIERICVEKWGSNGAVTANQLAAVTSPEWDTFRNNSNIVNGNDFVYFTGLTGKGHTFELTNNPNMTQITIPPHITEMFSVARCTSLTTINGLDHITKVDNNQFRDCSALQSLTFTGLTGVCMLGEGLTSLSSLTLNEGCTKLSMYGANSVMTSLNVPASVTLINVVRFFNIATITFAPNSQLVSTSGYGGFNGCRSLKSLVNFPWDTWTTMESYCFSGCSSLQGTIKTPVGLTNIPDNSLFGLSSINSIIVDSAVTTIGLGNFSDSNSNGVVIMNPTTPPTLSHSVGGNGYGKPKTTGIVFYVPDASYTDYTTNGGQYWTELYNNGRLKRMSELPS